MLQRWILRVLGREVAAAGFDPMGLQEVWASTSGAVESCNSYNMGFQGAGGSRAGGDVALRDMVGWVGVLPNLSDLMIQQDPYLSSWPPEHALLMAQLNTLLLFGS